MESTAEAKVKELKRMQELEEERTETAQRVREEVIDTRVMPVRRQVVQLVRNIGAVDSPDTMAVDRVNAELSQMLTDGWTLHTVRTLGVLPGGVSVYYCLIK